VILLCRFLRRLAALPVPTPHPGSVNVQSYADQLAFIRTEYISEFVAKELLPRADGIPKAGNAVAIVAEFFLRKATKSLDAICALCQNGFTEDALVLGRTIFEMCLHLGTIAQPDLPEQRQLRAESLIYDGERQRGEKRNELESLKRQRKCLDWINDIKAMEPVFQEMKQPTEFVRLKSLKDMATDLGGEWECHYHFVYWSISKLAHPSALGSHSYMQDRDLGAETHRAIALAFPMHYHLATMALALFDLGVLQPQLDGYAQRFVTANRQ
jgi:Family of unknown function (DUF5677)